jgi:MFS family permease
MTVFTLLAGSLTDALGLRRTFFLGVIICLIARSMMVFTTIPWLALAGGLFPLVIGEALGTPVLIAATRRYSTVRQRSISFSMIYMVMNVGYLIAGSIFDYVRHSLGEYGYLNLLGLHITTYRTLFLVSLGLSTASADDLFSEGGLKRQTKALNSRPSQCYSPPVRSGSASG